MSQDNTCCRLEVNDELISQAKTTLTTHHIFLKDEAKLFALLGNEVRLSIVVLFLTYKRMCVCDIGDVLGMKQSPISQHLRKLKDGGILENVREGMTIFYFINPSIQQKLERILDVR